MLLATSSWVNWNLLKDSRPKSHYANQIAFSWRCHFSTYVSRSNFCSFVEPTCGLLKRPADDKQAGNLYATLFDAIANQTIIITPLSGAMPSAQLIFDGLHHVEADALLLAPPFLEQIARSPEITAFVTRNVATVTYGGGDVSQWAGDALASSTRLFNFMGSTETGSYPLLRPSDRYPSEDWKYIHTHPAAGIEFQPSSNGLFEAVLVKNPVFEDEQPVFKLFPHLFEYPTKDLFAPHPSKPDLWTHRGRVDDTITFKSGHMCDPITMEQSVSQHPEVREVLMAGTGQSQPALLIEPEDNPSTSPATEPEMTE